MSTSTFPLPDDLLLRVNTALRDAGYGAPHERLRHCAAPGCQLEQIAGKLALVASSYEAPLLKDAAALDALAEAWLAVRGFTVAALPGPPPPPPPTDDATQGVKVGDGSGALPGPPPPPPTDRQ